MQAAFAPACPEADLFRGLPEALAPPSPWTSGIRPVRPFLPSSAFEKVMALTTAKRPNAPCVPRITKRPKPKNQSPR